MASFLGIDVSSRFLDGWVRPQGARIALSNDPAGFEQFDKTLRRFSIKRILLEATGGYEQDVMRFLQDASYKVIRVTPLTSTEIR